MYFYLPDSMSSLSWTRFTHYHLSPQLYITTLLNSLTITRSRCQLLFYASLVRFAIYKYKYIYMCIHVKLFLLVHLKRLYLGFGSSIIFQQLNVFWGGGFRMKERYILLLFLSIYLQLHLMLWDVTKKSLFLFLAAINCHSFTSLKMITQK